jgi:hypothetical protein
VSPLNDDGRLGLGTPGRPGLRCGPFPKKLHPRSSLARRFAQGISPQPPEQLIAAPEAAKSRCQSIADCLTRRL